MVYLFILRDAKYMKFFFAVLVFQTLTCICVCAFKSHKDKQVTVVYTWSSSNEYAMFLIILYESVCVYI